MWIHHLKNRGQEGGEAYCRAGADHSAASARRIATPRAGKKSDARSSRWRSSPIPDDKCLVVEIGTRRTAAVTSPS
ncbi:hypothetical protein [Bacteroides acidifaciens]|uniref:hypothetical protein n=1 Tax=Bacteroides acidifaciens TaxID=85831 RepID=UPI003F68F459